MTKTWKGLEWVWAIGVVAGTADKHLVARSRKAAFQELIFDIPNGE